MLNFAIEFKEYKLVMSERDSVHSEIEKLQEKVDAYEARRQQMDKKEKEREAEVSANGAYMNLV
jgi:hypothetical protein